MNASLLVVSAAVVAPQRAVLRGARLAAAPRLGAARSRALANAAMAGFYDLSAKACVCCWRTVEPQTTACGLRAVLLLWAKCWPQVLRHTRSRLTRSARALS